MNLIDAMEHYRSSTPSADFRQPDPVRSKRHGNAWRLRSADGELVAIVDEQGNVVRPGVDMTMPAGL